MRTTLRDAVLGVAELPWTHALYAPADADFGDEQLPVLVWDVDDVADDTTDLPEAAIALGFDYVLGVHDLQSIVTNTREQNPRVRVADLILAIQYYLDRDAFIDWSSGPHG